MNIEYISGANFSRGRRIFSWQKKAGDRVGVGGCSENEATGHQDQDQGPFVTFFWPAFASATTKINLQKFGSIWTILPEGFGFSVRAFHRLWGSLYACMLLTMWM